MTICILLGLIFLDLAASNAQQSETQAAAEEFETQRKRQNAEFEETQRQHDKKFADEVAAQEQLLQKFRKRMAKELESMAKKMAADYFQEVAPLFAEPESAKSDKEQLMRGVAQGAARDEFVSKVIPQIIIKSGEYVEASLRSTKIKLDDHRARQFVRELAQAAVQDDRPPLRPAPGKPGSRLYRSFLERKNKPLSPPVEPPRIGQRNSMFGRRDLRVGGQHLTSHCGLDMPHPVGTPVIAMGDGEVVALGTNKTSGKFVVVKADATNTDGTPLYYSMSHLSRVKTSIHENDRVKKGSLLGYVGNTGRSTGAHLHMAVKEIHAGQQRFVNPYKWTDGLPTPANLDDAWLQFEYCAPLSPE